MTRLSRRYLLVLAVAAVMLHGAAPKLMAAGGEDAPGAIASFQAQIAMGDKTASACFPDSSRDWQDIVHCLATALGHAQDAHTDTDGFRLGFGHRAVGGLEILRKATRAASYIDRRDWPAFSDLEDLLVEDYQDQFRHADSQTRRLCEAMGGVTAPACLPPVVAPQKHRAAPAAFAAARKPQPGCATATSLPQPAYCREYASLSRSRRNTPR